MKEFQPKTFYTSINDDFFVHDSIEKSYLHMVSHLGFDKIKDGGILTIYRQKAKPVPAGRFAPEMVCKLADVAFEEFENGGEEDEVIADNNWLNNVGAEAEEELNKTIEDAVNAWADKHNLHPKIYELIDFKEYVELEPVSETEFKVVGQNIRGIL